MMGSSLKRAGTAAGDGSGTPQWDALEQLFTEVSRGPKRESAMREVGLDGLIMLRWTT
jgi:hypothetical protein